MAVRNSALANPALGTLSLDQTRLATQRRPRRCGVLGWPIARSGPRNSLGAPCFLLRRRPAEDTAGKPVAMRSASLPPSASSRSADGLRLAHHERIVHQVQSPAPAPSSSAASPTTRLGSAKSNSASDFGQLIADHRQVDGATRELADRPTRRPTRPADDIAFAGTGDRRALRRRQVELAADGQHRVAQRLGFQPALRHAARPARCPGRPRSSWRRTASRADRPGSARCWRISFLTDQPSSMNETARWSSSCGIARRLAGGAEVVGRRHQPAAEQVQPDAVDHHAGRQRVVARGDASRPARAGRCPADRQRLRRVSTCGKPRGTSVAGLVELAADVERAVRRRTTARGRPSPAASACRRRRASRVWLSQVARSCEPQDASSCGSRLARRGCLAQLVACLRQASASFLLHLAPAPASATSPDRRLFRLGTRRVRPGWRFWTDADGAVAGLGAAEDAGQGVVVLRAGSGRTCDRGSGRRRRSGPGTPGEVASICSSTTSIWNCSGLRSSCSLGPMARKPVAIDAARPFACRPRRAAGRRPAARGRTGRRACRR